MTRLAKASNGSVLVMAGGTGGHIFPGVAVAEELQHRGWCANWLGSVSGMENELIGKTDIPLNLITISGLRGNGVLGWIKAPFTLCKAIVQALKIIHRVNPDVVIGFGGFASGPGGLAAFLLRKPLLIHEQNAIAGLTNKTLAKISKKAFQAFPHALLNVKRCETIGNPIRKKITNLKKVPEIKSKVNLLIVGGSRGAKVFNTVLPSILINLLNENKINICHQAGKGNKNTTLTKYKENTNNVFNNLIVEEFIEDMSQAYLWADLIICRAGALTVSEVAAVGVAAIFIPFPYAVDDHQTANATWLVEKNAAIMIKESELTLKKSSDQIYTLINNRQAINEMAENAKNVAYVNAAKIMADECELILAKAA